MDMNPFKPFIQRYEDFYMKTIAFKEPVHKLFLKLTLTRATA